MTQNIDRPRHHRVDPRQQNDASFSGYGHGQPTSFGYGTPPAGYAAPTNGIPQQFAPAPNHHGFPPPQAPPSNGIATGGLVVAIIAAVFSVIPVIGVVAWVLAPIGLVLSAVGLAKSRTRGGRGKSIAGVVLSIVALVMCIVWVSAVAHGVSTAQQQSATVHAVTYQVTTTKKTNVTVVYGQSQNGNLASSSVTDVAAPWSANAQVSGFVGPNVTASLSPDLKHMNRSDTITCTIVEDGVQVARNSATGPNASVSCMK